MHCFQRNGTLLFRRADTERAHIVQPVGKLHEYHAQILAHCKEHLAQIFYAFVLLCFEGDMHELRNAVDYFRHIRAEFLAYLYKIDLVRAVLHRIVQHCRADGIGIELELEDDLRNGKRVDNVAFARNTLLPAVELFRIFVSFQYFIVIVIAGSLYFFQQDSSLF